MRSISPDAATTEYCDFCAKNNNNLNGICEHTFIRDDQNVIIKDLLHIFPNDIAEMESNPNCRICHDCLEKLQNSYNFVHQIKEATALLKIRKKVEHKSKAKKKVKNNETKTKKVLLSDNENGGEGKNSNIALLAKRDSSLSSDAKNLGTYPGFRPILPKTSPNTLRVEDDDLPRTASTSRSYKCLECAETFKSFKHLREHETDCCQNKDANGLSICKYCHLCFQEPQSITTHQSLQHPEQQFLCYICKDKMFTSKGYLARHINKIHHHSCLQYFCGECDELFISPSQEDIKAHFNDVHPLEEANGGIRDDKSQEALNEEDMDLEMHEEFLDEFLLAHTNDSFQFSECWEALDLHLPDMLQAHSTSFHHREEFSEAFPCPKCFKQFKNPQPLLKHLAEEHNLPVLICRTCRKAFPSLKDFKTHKFNMCVKNLSLDILAVSCPYCSKKFNTSLSLKQHLRIVHTQRKKHICQLCDKQYSTLDHLKKHVLSQHQNERKHICQICTKSFTQLCHLKQHFAIHTTGKTIKCTECPERFWRNIDMQRHRTKKHGGI